LRLAKVLVLHSSGEVIWDGAYDAREHQGLSFCFSGGSRLQVSVDDLELLKKLGTCCSSDARAGVSADVYTVPQGFRSHETDAQNALAEAQSGWRGPLVGRWAGLLPRSACTRGRRIRCSSI